MPRLFRWLSAVVMAGLLAACGGPNFQPPADAPNQWQEAMRKEAPGGWVVWGYGTGSDPESLSAGRARADSRARANLAERTDARLQHLRERLVEGLAGEGNKELEQTDIVAVVRRAGEIAVNRAAVARRQRDGDGVWHALVRAELRPALREAAANRGLSASAADRLMAEADKMLAGTAGDGSG